MWSLGDSNSAQAKKKNTVQAILGSSFTRGTRTSLDDLGVECLSNLSAVTYIYIYRACSVGGSEQKVISSVGLSLISSKCIWWMVVAIIVHANMFVGYIKFTWVGFIFFSSSCSWGMKNITPVLHCSRDHRSTNSAQTSDYQSVWRVLACTI